MVISIAGAHAIIIKLFFLTIEEANRRRGKQVSLDVPTSDRLS